jgi:predicted  nucleic acid-binding Zn-ribbon protein
MQGMDQLLTLQEIDTAMDRLRVRRAALESGAELAGLRAEANGAEAAFGEVRLAIDELDREAGKLEHEVDSLTQKATAEEKRLYDGSVANAKELGSLQHEVDNLKRRRADREDEMLVLMERREGLDAEASEAEKRSVELRAGAEETAISSDAELERISADLLSLEASRHELVPRFDPELLELYDDLRAQKKGVGAAALVDGICMGCHEKLSAMELDKLRKTDGVKRCEYCRRILIG